MYLPPLLENSSCEDLINHQLLRISYLIFTLHENMYNIIKLNKISNFYNTFSLFETFWISDRAVDASLIKVSHFSYEKVDGDYYRNT